VCLLRAQNAIDSAVFGSLEIRYDLFPTILVRLRNNGERQEAKQTF
jgi:hypothetical protein